MILIAGNFLQDVQHVRSLSCLQTLVHFFRLSCYSASDVYNISPISRFD